MEQPHVVEHFFGVYLLYCENPQYKGRVYIGYTVDPVRRLKRHNAGIKFGGARRTNKRGPWKMVLVVHGFPNPTSALRFEWAWQHPQMSRRLRHVPKKKNSQKIFDYSLNVLGAMLKVGPWSRLPLTLRWLDPEFSRELLTNIIPPIHMPISYGQVQAKKINKGKKLKKGKDKDPAAAAADTAEQSLITDILICDICYMALTSDDRADCLKPDCDFMAHLICLANEFNRDDKIIPIEGSCPSCKTDLLWGDVIRKKIGCYLHLDEKSREESSDDSD